MGWCRCQDIIQQVCVCVPRTPVCVSLVQNWSWSPTLCPLLEHWVKVDFRYVCWCWAVMSWAHVSHTLSYEYFSCSNISLALLGIYGDGYARMSNRCNNLTTTNFVPENLMFSKASLLKLLRFVIISTSVSSLSIPRISIWCSAVYPPNDCDVDVNCCLATVLLPDICVGGGRQHLQ